MGVDLEVSEKFFRVGNCRYNRRISESRTCGRDFPVHFGTVQVMISKSVVLRDQLGRETNVKL